MNAAKRVLNHATGYAYTKHDHCQQWVMPDGAREMTGWIERGDTTVADKMLKNYAETIARLEADIVKWQAIRAGLEAEQDDA